jgi:adenylate cyclase
MESRNAEKKTANLPVLEHGIALHQGLVQYGNIGSVERLDFTIIGHDVNLTSRICSQSSSLGENILISERFAKILPKFLEIREKSLELKGIPDPRNLYVLSGSSLLRK